MRISILFLQPDTFYNAPALYKAKSLNKILNMYLAAVLVE